MTTSLPLFLTNMYWIDIITICAIVCCLFWLVMRNAKKVSAKNTQYNADLYAMRAEIYTEYEKNFFL